MPTTFLLPTYTIAGWSANSDDDFGCRWVVASQNASDGPPVKTRISERPYGNGSYRAQSFRASRPIPLTGWVQCPNRVAAIAARARFLALFTGGGQEVLTIDDGVGPKQTTVELASDPKVAPWSDATGFDWQLPLIAVDPCYYDTTVQSASTTLPTPGAVGLNWNGSVGATGGLDWASGGGLDWGSSVSNGTLSMSNTGTADTWPVFTFVGPLTLPMLTNTGTGQQLAYSGTLLAGDSLVITTNPFGRSVLLSGSDRFTLMTAAAWFPIPPASSVTVALAASAGSGSLSASWRSASW